MGELVVVAAVRRRLDGEYDRWVGESLETIQEMARRQNPHIDESTWFILPPEEVEAIRETKEFISVLQELRDGAKASYLGSRVGIIIEAPAV